MPRGNGYLSQTEVRCICAAIDSMLEHLPTGEDVQPIDRRDAERDRREFEALRAKLDSHHNT